MQLPAWVLVFLLGSGTAADVSPGLGYGSEPVSEVVWEATANIGLDPSRFVAVGKSEYWSIRFIKNRVGIAGSLSDADVESLLRYAEPYRVELFGKDGDRERWDVHMIGDDKYALIRYGLDCGAWCGVGADFVFARSADTWRFVCWPRMWVA